MPFRFGSPEHDLPLLRSVLKVKPFSRRFKERAWKNVAAELEDVNFRTCRDRTMRLLRTAEKVTDGGRQELLQKVKEDYKKAVKSGQTKARIRATEVIIAENASPMSAGSSVLTLDTDDTTLGSPPPMKRRVDNSYCEKKISLKMEELSLRRKETEIQQEQLEIQQEQLEIQQKQLEIQQKQQEFQQKQHEDIMRKNELDREERIERDGKDREERALDRKEREERDKMDREERALDRKEREERDRMDRAERALDRKEREERDSEKFMHILASLREQMGPTTSGRDDLLQLVQKTSQK